MELTQQQIEEINAEYPDGEQGIFVQPYGIPVSVKEPVIYERWETGGMKGGGYDEDDYLRPYTTGNTPTYNIFDRVIRILRPNITDEAYYMIKGFMLDGDNYDGSDDYYGNCEYWSTQYLPLSELYKLLEAY